MKSKDERLFDSRLIDRNLAKGLITQEEYDAHLQGLSEAETGYESVLVKLDDEENDDSSTDNEEE